MSGSASFFQLSAALGMTLLVGCAVSDNNLFGQSDAGTGGSSTGGSGGGSGTGAAGTGGGNIGGADGGPASGGSGGGVGGAGVGGAATGGGGSGGSGGAVGGSGGTGGLGGGGSGGTSTGGGGTSSADCCTAHTTPGCSNAAIQSCVCSKDAFCCSGAWDTGCVSEVKTLGCGNCGTGGSGGAGGFGGSGGTGGSVSGTDCCVAHFTPSCSVPSVAACVCAADSYCCQIEWDSLCVGEVDSEGCGSC